MLLRNDAKNPSLFLAGRTLYQNSWLYYFCSVYYLTVTHSLHLHLCPSLHSEKCCIAALMFHYYFTWIAHCSIPHL